MALTAVVLVRRSSTYWRISRPSQMRTSVCHPAVIVGPLPEAGLPTVACLPQWLPELVIQTQLPLLGVPKRKMPSVPGVLFPEDQRAM